MPEEKKAEAEEEKKRDRGKEEAQEVQDPQVRLRYANSPLSNCIAWLRTSS